MVCDSHIYVGRFNDYYFSPIDISNLMKDCEVSKYLVSSTSICGGEVSLAIQEIQKLLERDGEAVFPCLWMTESLMEPSFRNYIFSFNIPWKCIKIHPVLFPTEWQSGGEKMNELISLARELRVPLLIHTGYDMVCNAAKYETDIAINLDINFILAHGRPIEDTLKLLRLYSNVYVDSAFMPIEDIIKIVQSEFADRLLWGSDMPLPIVYYPDCNAADYYLNRKRQVKSILTSEECNQLFSRNFHRVF